MSITKNEGGVLREQKEFTKNVGGVLRNLKEITECKGGVLRKIFSKGESAGSLTWSIDTSISKYDTNSSIVSVSDDGFSIEYKSKSTQSLTASPSTATVQLGAPCICSNMLAMAAGTTIEFTSNSVSGSGTAADVMYALLVNSNGEMADSGTTNGTKNITLTVPTDGNYHIRLGGSSFTAIGSQSGTTYNYYVLTADCTIAFKQVE